MEPAVLIVNLAYATYAATGLCTRLRTLRTVLLISSLLFAGFGLAVGIHSVVAWNLGLAILNARSLATAATGPMVATHSERANRPRVEV